MNLSFCARLATLVVGLSALHCTTIRSTYVPTHQNPSEIVLGFEGRLVASKGGQLLSLADLPDAVACVPEARAEASKANAASDVGFGLNVFGLTGLAAGVGLLSTGAIEPRDDLLIAGAVTVLGSLVPVLVGAIVDLSVLPNRLDAINRYNDEISTREGCTGR